MQVPSGENKKCISNLKVKAIGDKTNSEQSICLIELDKKNSHMSFSLCLNVRIMKM
jgi:hypothetical protein